MINIPTNEFKDRVILVTGGTGSIGAELVRQLLKYKPKQVRVLSRNETRQYDLLESLRYPANIRMLIGDIRDRERLQLAFSGVDMVFHADALKHVPFCEYNPSEVIKTNVVGSHNVIDAALHSGVQKVIAISTDKVANPMNVLGTSKLMMEQLLINSNSFLVGKLKLACVRFGNVAWASGSVLPMWKNQAETRGSINVTNENATRFLMSIKQAVNLTIKAAQFCQGGEVFILKMPSIGLYDLARVFIKKYYPRHKIKIKVVGDRAGDKIHEDLLGLNDQSKEIWANSEMFILVPAIMDIHNFSMPTYFYEGFQKILTGADFSSKDKINLKKIEKII
jgi:FlaA1/EpsC-like NDP-sugar epimerase